MWVQEACNLFQYLFDRQGRAKLGTIRHFPQRSTLLPNSCGTFSLCIIQEGVVGLYSYSILGSTRVVHFLGPGDILTKSHVEGWSGHAVSATPVTLLCMDKFVLTKLTAGIPKLFKMLTAEFSRQKNLAYTTKCAIASRVPSKRFAFFLSTLLERPLERKANVVSMRGNPVVNVPISRTDLASYLGLSVPTINQEIQRLERLGIILQLTARHFEILDFRALELTSS